MTTDAQFKAHLVTSVVSGVLMLIVFGVVIRRAGLAPIYFLPVAVGVLLWPLSLVFYRSALARASASSSQPPVLLSIVGWAVISGSLLLVNYIDEGRVTWAIYPTLGAVLWPVSMVLYGQLVRHFSR